MGLVTFAQHGPQLLLDTLSGTCPRGRTSTLADWGDPLAMTCRVDDRYKLIKLSLLCLSIHKKGKHAEQQKIFRLRYSGCDDTAVKTYHLSREHLLTAC